MGMAQAAESQVNQPRREGMVASSIAPLKQVRGLQPIMIGAAWYGETPLVVQENLQRRDCG